MSSPKPRSTRFAFWLAICALLLKAAVPMLASASAQAQGRSLVEVCSVYGVKIVALHDARGSLDTAPPGPADAHGNEHCALTGLLAQAATGPAMQGLAIPAAQPRGDLAPRVIFGPTRDAQADWAARMRHGPPHRA